MANGEPPSRCSNFLIGRNSRGNWVARDQGGLYGGLFVSRADAVKFALFENGNRRQGIALVSDVLELDMSAPPLCEAPAPLQRSHDPREFHDAVPLVIS
jgi:hypothetical protein